MFNRKMKKSLFVLLLSFAALFVFNGCRKKAVGFEMDYRGRFEIPVGLEIISSHNFILKNIPGPILLNLNDYSRERHCRAGREIFTKAQYITVKLEIWKV